MFDDYLLGYKGQAKHDEQWHDNDVINVTDHRQKVGDEIDG